MSTVDAFLEQNPELKQNEGVSIKSAARSAELTISGVVLGITSSEIVFRSMNTEYRVSRDSIIDIVASGDGHQDGKSAVLTMKRDARLIIPQEISAADVAASIPFSLMRASSAAAESTLPSPKEARWRQLANYAAPLSEGPDFDETLDAFSTGSKSFCGRPRTDDSIVDDG